MHELICKINMGEDEGSHPLESSGSFSRTDLKGDVNFLSLFCGVVLRKINW